MNNGVFDQNDGQLTLIGEIATCLNMDDRQAKLIAMGHVYDHLQDFIIMGMLYNVVCDMCLTSGFYFVGQLLQI
jgi:hypothetical protein